MKRVGLDLTRVYPCAGVKVLKACITFTRFHVDLHDDCCSGDVVKLLRVNCCTDPLMLVIAHVLPCGGLIAVISFHWFLPFSPGDV